MKPLHERLIEHIKAGQVGFNLNHFFSFGLGIACTHELPEVRLRHDCTTVACIAGHLLLLSEDDVILNNPSGLEVMMSAKSIWLSHYPNANMAVFGRGCTSPESWPTEMPSSRQIERFLMFCTGLYDEQGKRRQVPADRVDLADFLDCGGSLYDIDDVITYICDCVEEGTA